MVMVMTRKPHMDAASRARLCLPEPPTPTSSAWPCGDMSTRAMRATCASASSNSTSPMAALLSLYSRSASSTTPRSLSSVGSRSYTRAPPAASGEKCEKSSASGRSPTKKAPRLAAGNFFLAMPAASPR